MAINILILTDYSLQALNAAKYAMNLSENSSKLYILNSENGQGNQMDIFIEELQKETSAQGKTITSIFSNLNLVEATRNAVVEKKIDLVVMGASGRSSSRIKGLGNNTYHVTRKVKCPVLVIPYIDFQPVEKIFFPFDNRFSVNKMLFSFLAKLPSLNKVKICLFELNLSRTKTRNTDEFNANSLFHLERIEPTDGFAEKCWKEINSEKNLILLSAKHLHVLEKFFLGNEIRKKLKQQTPVLILHEKT